MSTSILTEAEMPALPESDEIACVGRVSQDIYLADTLHAYGRAVEAAVLAKLSAMNEPVAWVDERPMPLHAHPPAAQDREDALRYRWLARKVSAHGICDGWQFGFPTALSLPAPPLAMRDPEAALGLAIDAAMKATP